MYGAILGDIIGSPYEFEPFNIKTKNFPLFTKYSRFTDDSVMTLAIAQAILDTTDKYDLITLKKNFIYSMQSMGRKYPNAGYGGNFRIWLNKQNPEPYGSFGNGSAMRVSSVAWLYDDIISARNVAKLSAEVSHNHPEGIKGAEATASAIFLARKGFDKTAIRHYIEDNFAYSFSRTCDEIRPTYRFDVSCMGTVPEAMTAFFESVDFEDCIRTAVSLGGDCDTLTAIAGSIAEAYYGTPESLKSECYRQLPDDLGSILLRFQNHVK